MHYSASFCDFHGSENPPSPDLPKIKVVFIAIPSISFWISGSEWMRSIIACLNRSFSSTRSRAIFSRIAFWMKSVKLWYFPSSTIFCASSFKAESTRRVICASAILNHDYCNISQANVLHVCNLLKFLAVHLYCSALKFIMSRAEVR